MLQSVAWFYCYFWADILAAATADNAVSDAAEMIAFFV